jgi:hypothetical protein
MQILLGWSEGSFLPGTNLSWGGGVSKRSLEILSREPPPMGCFEIDRKFLGWGGGDLVFSPEFKVNTNGAIAICLIKIMQ